MQPISSCTDRLTDLSAVLHQLSDLEYGMCLPVLNNASLGGHTRHIIEFYICLLDQYGSGQVNYDLRKRDAVIETNVGAAIDRIGQITEVLKTIVRDMPLQLLADFGYESGNQQTIPTSLRRELVYQLEHTVHHMALLRVGISHAFPHVSVPPAFGVAASTLRYSMDTHKP